MFWDSRRPPGHPAKNQEMMLAKEGYQDLNLRAKLPGLVKHSAHGGGRLGAGHQTCQKGNDGFSGRAVIDLNKILPYLINTSSTANS